jgi:hypothetical protein
MKKRRLAFGFFLLFFLYAESMSAIEIPDKYVITPGRGISFVRIGDAADAFIKALGPGVQPRQITINQKIDEKNTAAVNHLLLYGRDIGVMAVCQIDEIKKGSKTEKSVSPIYSIIISNTVFLVRENGLHVGSFESEVRRLMGSGNDLFAPIVYPSTPTKDYFLIEYPKQGIVFTIRSGDRKVVSIAILESTTEPSASYAGQKRIIGMGVSASEILIPPEKKPEGAVSPPR